VSGIVVDASITLSWCFPDEQTRLSIEVLDRLKAGDDAFVPAFWLVEVLNTLLVGEKRGRITPDQTRSFLEELRRVSPVLDCASME
jgi:predicted nucleic acid-binding protein